MRMIGMVLIETIGMILIETMIDGVVLISFLLIGMMNGSAINGNVINGNVINRSDENKATFSAFSKRVVMAAGTCHKRVGVRKHLALKDGYLNELGKRGICFEDVTFYATRDYHIVTVETAGYGDRRTIVGCMDAHRETFMRAGLGVPRIADGKGSTVIRAIEPGTARAMLRNV